MGNNGQYQVAGTTINEFPRKAHPKFLGAPTFFLVVPRSSTQNARPSKPVIHHAHHYNLLWTVPPDGACESRWGLQSGGGDWGPMKFGTKRCMAYNDWLNSRQPKNKNKNSRLSKEILSTRLSQAWMSLCMRVGDCKRFQTLRDYCFHARSCSLETPDL